MKNLSIGKIKPTYIFIVFVLLHLILFNINAAEWGDSYRILRASEYIREFAYPVDEKRPPLFSAILAVRPGSIDQVFWGRFIMFGFSLGSFSLFYRLISGFFESSSKKVLALILFTFNPVYLYWSLRIMADVPFSFLVLLAFVILKESSTFRKSIWPLALGFVIGLSILMRFEGYILFGACGLGIWFMGGLDRLRVDEIIYRFKNQFKSIVGYVFGVALTIAPYLYWRNPLNSSYFEEQTTRTFDINTVVIYFLSLSFLFGFVYGCFFFAANLKENTKFFKRNLGISSFIAVELLLVLWWPAAVPRLFTAIVPLLIIPLASSIFNYFDSSISSSKIRIYYGLSLVGLLGIYVLGQFNYRLQFLVLAKYAFVFVALVNLVQIYFIYKKSFKPFLALLVLSLIVWSGATIYIHKDIFKVIKQANVYIVDNLEGRVGYNDVSSISDWYLNQKNSNDNVEGVYYNGVEKENRELGALRTENLDYLLITNEHNTDTTIDLSPWPHLIEIKEFKNEINSDVFFTKLVKVSYN